MKKAQRTDGFDSDEEMYAYWYFDELRKNGYVKDIVLQPESFNLSKQLTSTYKHEMKTKAKMVQEEILKAHIYTADLLIVWEQKAKGIFYETINGGTRMKKGLSKVKFVANTKAGDHVSTIEVKPSYDQNNMTRLAKINQKWVWEKHGYFVTIMVPEKWFKNTFTPTRYLFTNKSGKPRSIKYGVKQLKEYLG